MTDVEPSTVRKIIWLASYPKSGNTWLRFLLGNLWYANGVDPLPTTDLGIQMPGSVDRERFAAVLGKPIAEATDEEVHVARYAVQEQFTQMGRTMVVKTHSAFLEEEGFWHIAPELTEAAIVMIRDPRDVVCSMMNYFSQTADEAIDMLNDQNYILLGDRDAWVRLLDWKHNVMSWTKLGQRAFFVRYEDLHKDPAHCLRQICNFVGVPIDVEKVTRAVENSSFKRLQVEEDAGRFLEADGKGERFFAHGKVGQWQAVLTPEQIERIEHHNYHTMKRFGYEPSQP